MDVPIEPIPLPPRRDGPTASSVLAAIVVVLVVAIIKPWGVGGVAEPQVEPIGPAPARAPSVAARPTPDVARELVSALCLEPAGWRLYATERWSDWLVRSWKSIQPVTNADGPGDPRIPQFPEASRAVLTLGYCAPVTGAERPPGPTTTTIYRRTDPVATPRGDEAWEVIDPARVQPIAGPTHLGGAWAPPDRPDRGAAASGPAPGWASGEYVFRIAADGADEAAFTRWFGVIVEVAPVSAP